VNCLRHILGEGGIIGRVGGEEFTVVLPGAEIADALLLAERMRAAIACHVFPEPVNRSITASFGVSDNPAGTDFDAAYGLADAALYAAKRNGRNRVSFGEEAESTEA
jgi:diguanylate cyclase